MVLAVDDVADAADGHAQDQADRRGVGEEADGQAPHPGVNVAAEHAADDGAEDGNAAFVEQQDLERALAVVAPLVDDVEEARADEAADGAPEGGGHDFIFGDDGAL